MIFYLEHHNYICKFWSVNKGLFYFAVKFFSQHSKGHYTTIIVLTRKSIYDTILSKLIWFIQHGFELLQNLYVFRFFLNSLYRVFQYELAIGTCKIYEISTFFCLYFSKLFFGIDSCLSYRLIVLKRVVFQWRHQISNMIFPFEISRYKLTIVEFKI